MALHPDKVSNSLKTAMKFTHHIRCLSVSSLPESRHAAHGYRASPAPCALALPASPWSGE